MPTRKDSNGRPVISQVQPEAAITGGELYIRGKGLAASNRPHVTIGEVTAQVVIGSSSLVIVKVPEGASAGELVVENGAHASEAWTCDIGIQIAENLHPVTSPAVDGMGNIYTTFSGSRGQKVPVAVYRVDLNFNLTPFINDMMNATGIAIGRDGLVYISSRFDGAVYQVTPSGSMSVFVEGMGVATGLVFDDENNLYVGDRSGTVFKISPSRQIFVFATIEPSISAYHLAWGPDQHLYVSGPTTSSFDTIYRVADNGDVEPFYRGLGRPQGMAFDVDGNLYSAASFHGRKGVVRITPDRKAELFVSGPGIVGLAFSPTRAMIVSTTNAVFRVDVGIRGSQFA
ncbi:MAG TPA: IPT/TIG domain-containing protein [Bryobacteraceae bacterium]|jgi:sugar lactone lactonase YvrE|nr:IPT/TIG domain-containing protein [Bryobacteraceae bacterium]